MSNGTLPAAGPAIGRYRYSVSLPACHTGSFGEHPATRWLAAASAA
jgi:hypothetical protein